MYQDLIEQYQYLMNRLDELPGLIAAASMDESNFVFNSGGWAGLGKNETERKMEVQRATNGRLDLLNNEFSATRYAAQLHASLLQFLAAHGQALAEFPAGATLEYTTKYVNGNGTAATLEDAAAIGL